jgi:hypothetical protein
MSFWWAMVMPGGALGMSDDGNRPTSSDRQATGQQPAPARCGRVRLPLPSRQPGPERVTAHDRRMPDYQLSDLKVGQPRGSESPLTLAFILESGDQVVILEGVAAAVTGAGRLQAFLDAYNRNTTGMPLPPTRESPTRRERPGRPTGCGPGSSSAGTSTCAPRPAGPSPTPPRL